MGDQQGTTESISGPTVYALGESDTATHLKQFPAVNVLGDAPLWQAYHANVLRTSIDIVNDESIPQNTIGPAANPVSRTFLENAPPNLGEVESNFDSNAGDIQPGHAYHAALTSPGEIEGTVNLNYADMTQGPALEDSPTTSDGCWGMGDNKMSPDLGSGRQEGVGEGSRPSYSLGSWNS